MSGRGAAVPGCVLLVGAGGIGAPAAIALAAAGVRELRVVDDDQVEITNLHRQILFGEEDVGRPKLDAFADALRRRFPGVRVDRRPGRFTPSAAAGLLPGASVVIDATDNFASRFLIADACHFTGTPVVHAAAIRWRATVMAAPGRGGPCYRCLFEDLPLGPAPDCATAGVAGPVCGVAGALAADRALSILRGDSSAFGRITTYDGLSDTLRSVPVTARAACALCGERPAITTIDAARYVANACAQEGREGGPSMSAEGREGGPSMSAEGRDSGPSMSAEGREGRPASSGQGRASDALLNAEGDRGGGAPAHVNTGDHDHG